MRLIERRIGLLFAGFLVAFLLIVCRAFWLQGVEASTLSSQALNQQTQTVMVPGLRGAILDRNGTRLASSEDAATIVTTPYLVKKKVKAANELGPILKQKPAQVLKVLNTESGFAYLAKDVDLSTATKIEKLGIEGIEQIPGSRRTYPQGEMAGQTIGVVSAEGQGLTGVELGENSALAGEEGERKVVTDALGDPIKLETVKEARDGEDVELTLDPGIQEATEQVLAKVGEEWSPKGATAIVMDPETSEILAMANWPPIDPGDLAHVESNEELLNKATGFNYEPGSTFKAFTVAAALEEKVVTPTTEFTLPPTIQVADRTIKDAEERGTETMTVEQILARSSNVGAITLAERLTRHRLVHWISRFGFGHLTGIDFPGESQGIVLPEDKWSGSSIGNIPIGQGIAVTPIQMASAYAAIANRGVWVRPHLVDHVGDGDTSKPARRRVVSGWVAREVMAMLKNVVAEGTGTLAAVPGYLVAGKTGTAAKPDPHGGYSDSRYVASFVGVVPASRPRLVILVSVDEPRGAIWGGVVAAPAFAQIAKFDLQYLDGGVPPDAPATTTSTATYNP